MRTRCSRESRRTHEQLIAPRFFARASPRRERNTEQRGQAATRLALERATLKYCRSCLFVSLSRGCWEITEGSERLIIWDHVEKGCLASCATALIIGDVLQAISDAKSGRRMVAQGLQMQTDGLGARCVEHPAPAIRTTASETSAIKSCGVGARFELVKWISRQASGRRFGQ